MFLAVKVVVVLAYVVLVKLAVGVVVVLTDVFSTVDVVVLFGDVDGVEAEFKVEVDPVVLIVDNVDCVVMVTGKRV